MVIQDNSFEVTTALAGLFLWLIFNFLGSMLNCDVQRIIKHNAVVRNIMGLIVFYFLFTVIDPNNNVHVGYVFLKTILVYTLFMLATKSRWQFIGAVLLLVFVDQVLKNHLSYLERDTLKEEQEKTNLSQQRNKIKEMRTVIMIIIVAVIITGSLDYMIKQRKEHKDRFAWSTFFLGTGACRASA